MSDFSDDDRAEPRPDPKVGLTKPIRDHLGEVLRTEYSRVAEKPSYLGDTPLPPEFEHKLLQIEKSEEIHEKGVSAVGEALGVSGPVDDVPPETKDGAGETEPPRA